MVKDVTAIVVAISYEETLRHAQSSHGFLLYSLFDGLIDQFNWFEMHNWQQRDHVEIVDTVYYLEQEQVDDTSTRVERQHAVTIVAAEAPPLWRRHPTLHSATDTITQTLSFVLFQ